MNKRLVVGTATLAMSLGAAGAAGSAAAGQPDWAGPPTTETFPLVEDPIFPICGDRNLTFTGGELVIRERELPGGRVRDVRRTIDGTAVDQFGNQYRVRAGATSSFDLATESGFFRLRGVVIGPRGMNDTINSTFSVDGATMTADERGTCTIGFR